MALYVWDETALEWVTGASFPPSGTAGGDLAGTYPNPTVHDVSILTTKGDLLGRGSSAPASRLAVGSDGQVLTADSASTLGVKWATGSGGGVTSLDSITGAVSLVAGSNVTITDNSPSAGDITIAASGGGGSGYTMVDYAQITSSVTVTASTEGTAQTIVSGGGFTADGTSHYLIEFWSGSVRPDVNSGNSIFITLNEGATVIGTLTQMRQPATGFGFNLPCPLAVRLVPTAAAHTYTVAAYVTAGTSGAVGAGAGGSGQKLLPAYLMVTRLA